MERWLRHIYSRCLCDRQYPRVWKMARLVLLRKEGRPAQEPSSYRPLCLIDEVGKVFEHILVDRMQRHLADTGPDLSPAQYGFRKGHSTIDAIKMVHTITTEVLSNGGVAIAVSLDIVNAFNSLPWTAIHDAMDWHGFPAYLRDLIRSYLSDRQFCYIDRAGDLRYEATTCGVPQGSILGPLLWDLAYDSVLRLDLPSNCRIVCYADDTCLIAGRATVGEAIALAEFGASCLITAIKKLGMKIAAHKTEAIIFGSAWPETRRDTCRLHIDGISITIATEMKYLGLRLDSAWFARTFVLWLPRRNVSQRHWADCSLISKGLMNA